MTKRTQAVLAWVAVVCLSGCAASARIKTHPDPDDRIEAMKKVIKSVQQEGGETESKPKE